MDISRYMYIHVLLNVENQKRFIITLQKGNNWEISMNFLFQHTLLNVRPFVENIRFDKNKKPILKQHFLSHEPHQAV